MTKVKKSRRPAIGKTSKSAALDVLHILPGQQLAVSRRQDEMSGRVQLFAVLSMRVRLAVFVAEAPFVHGERIRHNHGLLDFGPAHAHTRSEALAPTEV